MQLLLAFELTSDISSFELFDTACLGLKQATDNDIQDGVKGGLVALHVEDDMLRHHMDHARAGWAGHLLQGQGGGAGHRQSLRGCRRCSAHADRCSERQG